MGGFQWYARLYLTFLGCLTVGVNVNGLVGGSVWILSSTDSDSVCQGFICFGRGAVESV